MPTEHHPRTWRSALLGLVAIYLVASSVLTMHHVEATPPPPPPYPATGVVALEHVEVSTSPILTTSITPSARFPHVAYAITFDSDTGTTLTIRKTYTGGELDGLTRDVVLNNTTAVTATAGNGWLYAAPRSYDNNADGTADGTVSYNFLVGTGGQISLHVTEVRSDVR